MGNISIMEQEPLVRPPRKTQYTLVIIIGIILGAGAVFMYFKQIPGVISSDNTYKAGFEAAKNRVLESPLGSLFRAPDDIHNISGGVTAVNGNVIVIHLVSTNPFDDPALDNRTVIVTPDTKILKITPQDTEAFRVKMDAFMKMIQAGKGDGVPPQQTHTTVILSNIKVGDMLAIITIENIKSMKEFPASQIIIQ